MAEKFSAEFTLMREEMRIISGITALNLIREKRYSEAEVYRRSFVEIKDCSADDLAVGLGSFFVPNSAETVRIAKDLLAIANILSGDLQSIDEEQAKGSTQKLTELLDAVTSKSRA